MKKINKLALFTMASIFASSALIAQEADASAEDTEITAETDAVADDSETTEATEEEYSSDDWGSSDDFGGDFDDFSSDDSAPTYYINAETGVDMRGYIHTVTEVDDAKVSDMTTASNPYANMTLGYSAQSSEMEFKLKFNKNSLGEYNEDILDEATARLFLGNFVIEGGKMKVVWGKGDKLHVLDNFNANDYTDFIFGEYIDRRIAEPMLSVKFNTGNWSVQGVATPSMTADRLASSGVWTPYAQTKLTDTVTGIVKHNAALSLKTSLTSSDYDGIVDGLQDMSSFSSDDLYEENIKALKYGQGGIRILGTLGSIDVGASYYYGHYKQPSANLEPYITSLKTGITNAAKTYAASTDFTTKYGTQVASIVTNKYGTAIATRKMTEAQALQAAAAEIVAANAQEWYEDGTITVTDTFEMPILAYDLKQTFGLEAAFVVWKFNTRWELGYNLTEDTAGDNPWVHNNSIEWLGGFDINLFHNVSLNVQETGKYILNNNKIEDGVYKVYDVDYNSDGKYITNKLVVNISDTFFYENLKPEVTVIWGIENGEWCVQPKINYKVVDGMNLGVSGGWLYSDNENGEFYNFTADCKKHHSKSFVQASVRYEF